MSMHTIKHTYDCCLTIAHIGLRLRCADAEIATALRQRYAAFLCENAAQLTLDVVIDGDRQCGNIEVVMVGWTVRDAAAPEQSWLDVAQGCGQVVVSHAHAGELIEYWLRVAYALLVFRAGGLLFHAAGVVRNERAFLFCGRSGSGKTTVARLSPHNVVLNDDLLVLMPDASNGWIAHATPFSSPTQVQPAGPCCAPLAAVLRLVQDTTVVVRPMHAGLALAELLANAPVVSANPAFSAELIARCQQIERAVPVRHLHFLPDPSFWPVVESLVG